MKADDFFLGMALRRFLEPVPDPPKNRRCRRCGRGAMDDEWEEGQGAVCSRCAHIKTQGGEKG